MGLDMWIRRVKKIKLEEREYTQEEISAMGYSAVSINEVEGHLFEQLAPYAVVRNVLTSYYNVEKMIADYNLPETSYIGYMSFEGIKISGRNEAGEDVGQFISTKDVNEKYTLVKSVPHYIWEESDEAYWRKHYDLQDFFYNNLEDVDNCGYYILDASLIAEMNEKFHEDVSEVDPTDDEALFYHEWY